MKQSRYTEDMLCISDSHSLNYKKKTNFLLDCFVVNYSSQILATLSEVPKRGLLKSSMRLMLLVDWNGLSVEARTPLKRPPSTVLYSSLTNLTGTDCCAEQTAIRSVSPENAKVAIDPYEWNFVRKNGWRAFLRHFLDDDFSSWYCLSK